MTKNFAYIILALLAGAFLPMPYGYYQFLKIAVFISALYYTFRDSIYNYCWCGIAILYNPVTPLYFKRATWEYINIATIIFILFWIYTQKRLTGKKN